MNISIYENPFSELSENIVRLIRNSVLAECEIRKINDEEAKVYFHDLCVGNFSFYSSTSSLELANISSNVEMIKRLEKEGKAQL